VASPFAFPTQGTTAGGSDIPPGTGYVYQDPPGTFASLASIPGGDLDAGSVTNAKLQYSSVTLAQPAAGLTITSSVALGETATFALADDLAALEGLGSTGFAVRSGTSAWVQRSLAVGSGLSISNSDGTSGNPTISLGTELAGLAGLATTGLVQRTGAGTYSTTTAPAISGANFTAASIDVAALAFSATSRMLPNTSIALANVMITGNGTSWTNTTSAGAGFIMTSGATVASWQNSLTGITINGSTNTITNLTTAMLASGFNLAATQGGTGQTTYTTGDLLYASSASALSRLAASTSGYVLTSNGAGSAPSYKVPVTDSTGSAALSGSSYSVTSSTFANVGLTAAIPSAGKWRVTAEVRVQLQVSASVGNITLRMHDGTSAITNTERISPYSSGSVIQGATVPVTTVVSVAGATNIDVQAALGAGPTYTSASVISDGSGRTMIFWERLS